MKNKYFVSILVLALVFVAGTAYVTYAHGSDFGNMEQIMTEQGVNTDEMYELMNSGDWEDMEQFMEEGNFNFGQMLPYMQQVHPDLNTDGIKELYESCHGTVGSSESNNFRGQGMMGN